METYDPQAIEAKWQRVWEDARAFYTDDPEPGDERAKFYMLEMLPYPSGDLHLGHVLNYTLGDVLTHFRRRHGLQVLRPMGWDSFGLPAENAAIREGGNPREITERNIANIERQMHRLGWAIDWDRVIAAHDPAYYRWTQWLFLRFFEKGLAYRKEAPVNWCPHDQTVLANEQVIDGRCERCGTVVEARKMEQWFFRITAYADELLEDHALLDWPERTITIQRNWIGRSEGAELLFRSSELDGLRRDLLCARARASARRHGGRALVARRRDPRVRQARAGQARRGSGRGRAEDRGRHRPDRDEPGDR
jgi:leucyl-tRNA synthetase